MPIKSLVVTFVQLQVSVSKMAGMKNAGHSWNIQANLAFTGHPENTFEIFKSCHGKKKFRFQFQNFFDTVNCQRKNPSNGMMMEFDAKFRILFR